MALLGGIDLGSFTTDSYVAWLEDGHFLLETYRPSREWPLPESPGGWPPAYVGIDGPQGLPEPGERRRRECDRLAKTPTRVLPRSRAEMASWRLYRPCSAPWPPRPASTPTASPAAPWACPRSWTKVSA